MTGPPLKLSEIMKEMAERLLRHPSELPSLEAANVALFFANEADNPELWNEFKSNDINALIDELAQYKKTHYPNDQRRILTCGIPDGNIRVEWLNAAAPGIDSKWEMQLYGLVKTGEREKAIRFLQETRGISYNEAVKRVAGVAAELGMK